MILLGIIITTILNTEWSPDGGTVVKWNHSSTNIYSTCYVSDMDIRCLGCIKEETEKSLALGHPDSFNQPL